MFNMFIKILLSLPVIFITLYFIPFLGICLLIVRLFVNNRKNLFTASIIFITGIVILIPKILNSFLNLTGVSFLNNIINNEFYNVNLIKYSKLLITIGVIFLLLTYVIKIIFNKFNNSLISYIKNVELQDEKISKENDLEMKIKREKMKTTNYVRCPYCGSDNFISFKTGRCQYCRRVIENKKEEEG